ncbi:MAG: dienelactone hydrolase family protein, partial [Lentisphaeria bacterium]|nr:dienelactone hydrolase family protein [Lentisphaeria bacterium]
GFLFLPDDPRFKAPYPAVLLLLGHSETGKCRDNYFHLAEMAVKEGFGVFVPDPLSQGERVQQEPQHKWNECAAEHTSLGARAWLLGWNFARFRLNDAVRSIDYMETRRELDLSKLAVTGCSGGGTMSAYLQAFDNRIKAAAPSCYISSMREVIRERGLHDAEQFFSDSCQEASIMRFCWQWGRLPPHCCWIAATLIIFRLPGVVPRRKYSGDLKKD